jgi:hypothetical protein
MKQSFAEIAKIATEYYNEVNAKAEVNNDSMVASRSPLTQKYFNRLLFVAAQKGEGWAM